MRAVQYTQYGFPGGLEVRDVPKPIPGDTQVLVRVLAASANALDWRPLTFPPLILRLMGGGRRKPRDPSFGVDLAGVVESVGRAVTRFKAGDEVFGVGRGAFAEYACAEERKIASKPASVPFHLAAATPVAGCTALQALRDKGGIRPGKRC
jgi:NADPH:quinone reductase-like Zn-dependent oxidoreductase